MQALPRRVSLTLTFLALTVATAAVPVTTVLTASPDNQRPAPTVLFAPDR